MIMQFLDLIKFDGGISVLPFTKKLPKYQNTVVLKYDCITEFIYVKRINIQIVENLIFSK